MINDDRYQEFHELFRIHINVIYIEIYAHVRTHTQAHARTYA